MPQANPKRLSVPTRKQRLQKYDKRGSRAVNTYDFRRSLAHRNDTDRGKAAPEFRWGRPNPVMGQPNGAIPSSVFWDSICEERRMLLIGFKRFACFQFILQYVLLSSWSFGHSEVERG